MKVLYYLIAAICMPFSVYADEPDVEVLWSRDIYLFEDSENFVCEESHIGVIDRGGPEVYGVRIVFRFENAQMPGAKEIGVTQSYLRCKELMTPRFIRVQKKRGISTQHFGCYRGSCPCTSSEYYELDGETTNAFNKVFYPRGQCPQN